MKTRIGRIITESQNIAKKHAEIRAFLKKHNITLKDFVAAYTEKFSEPSNYDTYRYRLNNHTLTSDDLTNSKKLMVLIKSDLESTKQKKSA